MANEQTYDPNFSQSLNKARLGARQLSKELSKAQKNAEMLRQSGQETRKLLKKQEFGQAFLKATSTAQQLDDQYDLSKRSLNVARMQSTAQETAEAFAAIEKAAAEKSLARGLWAAIMLAHSHREKINNHDNSPFFFMFLAAMASDLLDLSIFLGWPIKVYLLYTMFGRGAWKAKMGAQLGAMGYNKLATSRFGKKYLKKAFALIGLDFIPLISSLPLTMIGVAYAWRKSSQEAEQAKKDLAAIEQQIPDIHNEIDKLDEQYTVDYSDAGFGEEQFNEYETYPDEYHYEYKQAA
jgi:hypothetical protein